MENNEKIWEKQPYETNLQYRYFHEYLLMNYEIKQNASGKETLKCSITEKRSIRNLAKKLNKNWTSIAKMSMKNEWQKRIEAFDLYMLNEIKIRREKEYIEAQDRYSDMGKEIFDGIAKTLQNIDWQKLKPCDMERLAKVAHMFELGDDTGSARAYNSTQTNEEASSKALDSDARERMKKIYEDSVKKPPVPKKIKKMKQIESEE